MLNRLLEFGFFLNLSCCNQQFLPSLITETLSDLGGASTRSVKIFVFLLYLLLEEDVSWSTWLLVLHHVLLGSKILGQERSRGLSSPSWSPSSQL